MKEAYGRLIEGMDDDIEYTQLDVMCEKFNLVVKIDDEDASIFIEQHGRKVIIERDQMKEIVEWLKGKGVIS